MKMPFRDSGQRCGQEGSVVLTVALILSLLVLVFGFVIRTGFAVARKHQVQAGLDAAAMAGVRALCSGNAAETARAVAVENGLPDTDALTVSVGFYDELGLYGDFSEFTDFEADPLPVDTPYVNEAVAKISDGEAHYNNAVMVSVDTTESDPTGGLGGGDVRTRDYAVAYGARYSIIAGDKGMTVSGNFAEGYPLFKDSPIHANGDITFLGNEAFEGERRISATGTVSNCTISYSSSADWVRMSTLDQDLDRLKTEANAAGTLIRVYELGESGDVSFGNYIRDDIYELTIQFNDGDHNGKVYFLDVLGSDATTPEIQEIGVKFDRKKEHTAYNFILATNVDVIRFIAKQSIRRNFNFLGGPGEDMVSIYAAGEVYFQPLATTGYFEFICEGVFFRCEHFNQEKLRKRHPSLETRAQKIRIVADKITCNGELPYAPSNLIYDGTFGPPCPPVVLQLGALVPAGG